MGSDPDSLSQSDSWTAIRRLVVVVLVCSLTISASATAVSAGGGWAAQQEGEANGTDEADSSPRAPDEIALTQNDGQYAVEQDGQCFDISALSGNESVREFYGYTVPFEGNPYRSANGTSYSSEGTTDLQRPDTSILFLYEGPDGNLSLVFVHGKFNGGADGGSVSANLSGLPEDGRWAVKDDEYGGQNNFDRWRTSRSSATVDWTYGSNSTDGGAYEGLGDSFEVTVDPAFNREAALYRQYYDGTIRNWSVITGSREDPRYRSLDMSEPVTISQEDCGALDETPAGDETSIDSGSEPSTDSGGESSTDPGGEDDNGIGIAVGGEDGVHVDENEEGGVSVTIG